VKGKRLKEMRNTGRPQQGRFCHHWGREKGRGKRGKREPKLTRSNPPWENTSMRKKKTTVNIYVIHQETPGRGREEVKWNAS